MSNDPIKIQSEMNFAFMDGKVANATEEDLQRWLQALCTWNVPNEGVRHREIIRALTINHIQMARTIRSLEETMRRLNAANVRTQRLLVRLTWMAVLVAVIQAAAAVISLTR
jgi:hypothetical protein